MNLRNLRRITVPMAMAALTAGLAGCDGGKAVSAEEEGVPLAELPLTGKPPSGVVVIGPDEVRIRQGDTFAITIDADGKLAESLRFTLSEGMLGVLRRPEGWADGGKAIINVTMPAPERLIAAGPGSISAEAIAARGAVTIAGSGTIETLNVSAEQLDVQIAGSGAYRAAGIADRLRLRIAGSGDAQMEALKAGAADIRIAGSGHGAFASDGDVSASIVGSGEVRVRGKARCTAKAAGSGRLVCETTPS